MTLPDGSFARASALTLAVAPALVVLAAVDPNEPGHYPACPFKAVTGLDCPGCGSLRAIHSLTHGDLLPAVDHNALLVVVLPLLVVLAVRWVRRRPPLPLMYARWFGWTFLATAVGWMVLRNLPFLEPLAATRAG